MEFLTRYWIYGVGFIGQSLFGARLLVQWFYSEKQGKVVSPTLYWQLSLIGSFIILLYGILRTDVIIILGQILSYYIYIRNLQLKNNWKSIHRLVRIALSILPVTVLWVLLLSDSETFVKIFTGSNLLHPLSLLGAVGQLTLNLRFVYQWYYSERKKMSVLPLGFWILSLVASVMILIYGFYRRDPVLLVSQSLGLVAYTRNIFIYSRSHRAKLN
ncbi:MAG: lipid-A-disaccharide synthase N-terminal domain-containing protein [Chryseolinea sp.]